MEIIAGKKALQSAFTTAELYDDTLPGFHLVIQLHSQFLSGTMFYDFCSLTLSQPLCTLLMSALTVSGASQSHVMPEQRVQPVVWSARGLL